MSKAYPIPTEANRLESTTFTVFAIHGGGIRETKPTEDWTLRQLIEATKAGTIPGSHLNLAEMVVRVRDCNAKEERDKAKPSLPYAIPTGRFGKRGDDGWEESNGLLVLDRDGDLTKEETKEVMRAFAKLPWTCFVFRGPSGRGAKAFIHAPFLASAENREEAKADTRLTHQAIAAYLADKFPDLPGHQDSCGEKIAQAHFLSHDPDCVDRLKESKPLTWAFVEEWTRSPQEENPVKPHGGDRAGDAYNSLTDIRDRTLRVLSGAGWSVQRELGESFRLCRPGKAGGVSATLWGNGALHVFTTSDADLPEGTHTPFHVLATLEYGGDYKAAAKALAQELSLSPTLPKPTTTPASIDEGKVPEVFFLNTESKFYIPSDRGNGREVFVGYSRGEMERILKSTYPSMKPVMEEKRVVDEPSKRFLTEAARDRCFEAVLALPRREPGLETLPDGSRVLIPRPLDLPTQQNGEYPFIAGVLRAALGGEQYNWLWWWLASSLQGLYAGEWSPAPVVVLVGPGNSFKSFLQNFIITPALGGRSADPMKFMAGDTHFNGDLAEATHLCISDQRGGDSRQRKAMKEFYKSVANDEVHDIHPKGRQAVRLPTHWRMTVSANAEDDSLNALPDLDDSSEGKIAFLKMDLTDWDCLPEAAKATGEKANKERRRIVEDELPRMVGAMLKAGEVPEELRERIPGVRDSGRYAINAYHHPEIVQLVKGSSSSGTFAEEVADTLRQSKPCLDEIRGKSLTAAEVLNALRTANPSFSYYKTGPFSKQLKRMSNEHPELVLYQWDKRSNGAKYIVDREGKLDPKEKFSVVPFTAEALQ